MRQRLREERARRTGVAPSAAAVAAEVDLHKRLLDAVKALPDPYRSVLWSHYFHHRSARRIAEDLEVPVETVRTHLKRAVERLRLALDREHDGDRRSWQVALVPLLVVPRSPQWEGLAVTATSKATVAVAGTLACSLALWGGWRLLHTNDERSPGATAPAEGSGLEAQQGASLGLQGAAVILHNDSAPPAPIDLSAADRRRDLHGVVVRTDGTPVAGAHLDAIERPWSGGGLFTLRKDEEVVGKTVSAADGTFLLRLRPGLSVDLRVRAPGTAEARFHALNAGERARLVLPLGVRLCVDVRDEQGRPVPSCRVRMFGSPVGTISQEREGDTDESGTACFDALMGGNEVTLVAKQTLLGDSGWTTFRLPDEGEARTTLVLPAGRVVEGRVYDADTGAPLAAATVGSNWTASHPVTTDADGRFVYRGWTGKGTSVLTAYAEGYPRLWVKVGDQVRIEFPMRRGSVVTGRVLGPDGTPVADALVSGRTTFVEGTDGHINSFPNERTDATGVFTLAGVWQERDLDFAVIARGAARHAERIAKERYANGPLDLGDIRLRSGHALRGVAVDSEEKPVARLLVYLSGIRAERPPQGRWDADGFRYGLGGERFTDDLGRFAFEDLPPGPYRLVGRPKAQAEEFVTVIVPEDGDQEAARLVIPSTRSVRVTVETPKGAPIPGAHVGVMGRGTSLGSGTTDASGIAVLRLVSDAESLSLGLPGDMRDRFLGSGWHALRPDESDVKFVLRPALPATGRVLDEAGAPVVGIHVGILVGGEREDMRMTDDHGAFRVPVPVDSVADLDVPGSGQRTVSPGGAQQGVDFGVEGRVAGVRAGDEGLILRVAPRTRTLRVRVTLPDGSPVAQTWVQVRAEGWTGQGVMTGEDGWAALEKLPNRRITVEGRPLQLGSAQLLETQVEVLPEGQEISLRLRQGALLLGQLTDDRGLGVSGVEIAVRAGDRRLSGDRTTADGKFSLLLDPELTPLIDIEAIMTTPNGVQMSASRRGVRADSSRVLMTLKPAR